jgi:hypothetical protein
MNTIAVTPTVAPNANDMMFPLMVMSVMPIATQPMNDTVVRSARMLGSAKKPGVVRMTASRMTMPTVCAQKKSRAWVRRPRSGSAAAPTPDPAPAVERSVMGLPGWDA